MLKDSIIICYEWFSVMPRFLFSLFLHVIISEDAFEVHKKKKESLLFLWLFWACALVDETRAYCSFLHHLIDARLFLLHTPQ